MAYPALDDLAASWADLAQLVERHAITILADPTAWAPATIGGDEDYQLTLAPMALVGYSEQARRAAQRSFLPAGTAGSSQDDVAPPTFAAWESATRAGELLDASLAILAVIACEALRRSARAAPPPLDEFASEVLSAVTPMSTERSLAQDTQVLSDSFTERVLSPDPDA
jgi:histidine ammonia-lyase